MAYGLPYQGSKNAIAERIVAELPTCERFCDCCCGGGAILQAAVLSGKYKVVHGYDINKAIIGLIKATMIDFGSINYDNFPPVSKQQFYEARDRNATLEDWLIRYTCSFGFKGQEYLWGESRIKYKTLMHNAVSLPTLEERRSAMRDLMSAIVKDNLSIDDIKNLQHNEQLTNLNRFHVVENSMRECKTGTKLAVFCKSMFDIPFENYDILYFDPPYQGTTGYNRSPFSHIMFKSLLSALVQSGKHVYVSEYECPCEGFREVASFKKQMTLKCDENRVATEKLFHGGPDIGRTEPVEIELTDEQ